MCVFSSSATGCWRLEIHSPGAGPDVSVDFSSGFSCWISWAFCSCYSQVGKHNSPGSHRTGKQVMPPPGRNLVMKGTHSSVPITVENVNCAWNLMPAWSDQQQLALVYPTRLPTGTLRPHEWGTGSTSDLEIVTLYLNRTSANPAFGSWQVRPAAITGVHAAWPCLKTDFRTTSAFGKHLAHILNLPVLYPHLIFGTVACGGGKWARYLVPWRLSAMLIF